MSDVNGESFAIGDTAVIDLAVCDQVTKCAAVATVDWMTVANAVKIIKLESNNKNVWQKIIQQMQHLRKNLLSVSD